MRNFIYNVFKQLLGLPGCVHINFCKEKKNGQDREVYTAFEWNYSLHKFMFRLIGIWGLLAMFRLMLSFVQLDFSLIWTWLGVMSCHTCSTGLTSGKLPIAMGHPRVNDVTLGGLPAKVISK